MGGTVFCSQKELCAIEGEYPVMGIFLEIHTFQEKYAVSYVLKYLMG